jgi:hypothetical protein
MQETFTMLLPDLRYIRNLLSEGVELLRRNVPYPCRHDIQG